MRWIKIAALAAAVTGAAGWANAQNTRTPMSAATPAAKSSPVAHSAQSIECSKEADAKGLHGKARKTFRSQCKSGATSNK